MIFLIFSRVDKHRPNALDKVDYHKAQAEQLQKMVRIIH